MSSKLVENLAEELVAKLKEDGTLDLSDNEKFEEFTDLLYEILDNGVETEQRIIDTNDKIETVDKKTDDLGNNINSLAESIYNYFNKKGVENTNSGNSVTSSGVLNNIQNNVQAISVNQHRVLAIVEKLQSDTTAQGNDIKEIRKKLDEKPKDNTTTPTTDDTIPTDSSDDEKGSKHHVRTILYLKSIKGSIKKSEHNLRKDNKRMERSIKSKIKSGFGKWWGRFKKILLIAAIFLFGGVIKRILGGIAEMTEPMWRPFVDWFQKNFPKLTEGIQWVMHAVGEILDFALTLKGLYDKYYGDATDEQKEAVTEAGIVASSTATGFAVAGLPGAAVGALVGSFSAALHDINNEKELTEKYEAARKEYETALENKNLTAMERQRIKTEMAELDYLYQQKHAEFLKRESYRNNMAQRSMVAPTGMTYNPMQMNYLDPKYKEQLDYEKYKYKDMQEHPERYDESGNYDLSAATNGMFAVPSSILDRYTNDGGANITSNNSFTTIEVTVRPEDSPLKPK